MDLCFSLPFMENIMLFSPQQSSLETLIILAENLVFSCAQQTSTFLGTSLPPALLILHRFQLLELKGKIPSIPEGPLTTAPLATIFENICRSLRALQSCIWQQHLRAFTHFWNAISSITKPNTLSLHSFKCSISLTADLGRFLQKR